MSASAPGRPLLDWEDGQPVSRLFSDVYFSRSGGLAETRHVFLGGNRLAQRFAELAPNRSFVIGETGFGAGLNFVCAWHLFEHAAAPGARLHFVSTELYPLSPADLDRAIGAWPELQAQRERLVAQYRPMMPGWHRFAFDGGRVLLTLLIGDARTTLPELGGQVDAWFLDGFAPAKNPQLWEPVLLRAVAARSRLGTTVATYSCAGAVRRGLAAAGFRVWKAKGFGSKREMLCGELERGPVETPAPADKRAVVIGGGLAGASAASSLVRRGWRVLLLERHEHVAAEASGNPQSVLYARLSAHSTPLSGLVLSGYQYTLRLLRDRLPCDGEQWSDCTVLQLAFDAKEARRQQDLLALDWPQELFRGASAGEATEIAGLPLVQGGLAFPGGGWVHSPALCSALIAQPRIDAQTRREPLQLVHGGGLWRVLEGRTLLAEAAVVVIAAAGDSLRFEQTAWLPLRVNRGQITLLPATPASTALRAVLCGEHYVAPARLGLHTTGATFARVSSSKPTAGDNAQNLATLRGIAASLYEAVGARALDASKLAGRAALRCVSPDYLPIAGPVPDAQGVALPGLLASIAHGSRGLVTAPLAGEILASYMESEPAPLPESLIQAVSPLRFAARGELG